MVQSQLGLHLIIRARYPSPSRRPLGDISNGPSSIQVQKPKWKKLARAHKPTSEPPAKAQPHKRDLLLIEEDPVHRKRLRAGLDQCNFGNTLTIENTLECMSTKMSAAAVSQPCRKP
jgi:hypothetical protein